jgi:hypothetical protein
MKILPLCFTLLAACSAATDHPAPLPDPPASPVWPEPVSGSFAIPVVGPGEDPCAVTVPIICPRPTYGSPTTMGAAPMCLHETIDPAPVDGGSDAGAVQIFNQHTPQGCLCAYDCNCMQTWMAHLCPRGTTLTSCVANANGSLSIECDHL